MLISIFMLKMIFINYLPPVRPKLKSAQNLLKFGTFDISNMSISILMSEIIFIKYLPPLPPVRPKSSVKWGHLGHLDPTSTNTISPTNPMGSSGTL